MYYNECMDSEILQGIGLPKSHAEAYIKLLEVGEISPPKLAELINESRTTTYSILESLQKVGLARKNESGVKLTYVVTHPVNLESFVERRRRIIANWGDKLNGLMPALVNQYYTSTQHPEMQVYQGADGLKKIFGDILNDKADVYIIETSVDHEYLGKDYLDRFIAQRIAKKITAHILSPQGSRRHNLKNDKAHKIVRYFYDEKSYSTPVEINIYGNKVAYLSYGEEVIGTILHSPQIARAQLELFNMIKLASKTG